MVTAEFYALRELRLHQICEDLGVADERSMALQNVDVFSAVIFTALPGRFAPSSNEVFQVAAAAFLGVPCRHFGAHRTVRGVRAGRHRPEGITMDSYGFGLSNWEGVSRTPFHNTLMHAIARKMRWAGRFVQMEPRGFLLGDMAALEAQGNRRGRPGRGESTQIIPDLVDSDFPGASRSDQRLRDIKTHGGGDNYRHALNVPNSTRSVDKCADAVNGQYRHKAKKIDKLCNPGLGATEVGPLQRQLQRHGGAQGLAFGFYGEASRSIHELAKELAEEIAGQPDEDWICSMGENRASKVRNSIIKDWGLAATFGFAEFKLKGLYKIRKGNLLSRGAAIAMQEDMALQEEAENPAIGHGGAGEWRDG